MEADITSQAVGLASNTDFSIMTTLFLRADIHSKVCDSYFNSKFNLFMGNYF